MVNSKSSVFLFIGNDAYSKEKAIEKLKSSLFGKSSDDLNYKAFDGRQTNASEILGFISTVPFLSPKRLAVIKEFEKLPPESRASIVGYIKKPAGSACLVLDLKDDSVVADHKDLARYVSINRFEKLADSDFSEWVKAFLSSNGKKKIEPDALEDLRELQAEDLQSLARELEKLIAFVGEKNQISAEDVSEVVGKNVSFSVFDLVSAIEKNDVDQALGLIADLVSSGKRHYEIIGLLCWHLRRVSRAKILQIKGESDFRIANILKINRRYHDVFFRQVKAADIGHLKSRMEILLEADFNIKRSKYAPTLVLEFAVIRLCLGVH